VNLPEIVMGLRKMPVDKFHFVAQSDGRYCESPPLMKKQWFKRFGWFDAPVSVPGAVACLFAALFCLTVFMAVDRHSHSASDALYGIFPFFVCTFLLIDWIAGRTSGKPV
jgi:hypothetical protein